MSDLLDPLPAEGLTATAAARFAGVSVSQWWRLHASGRTPRAVYLGEKAPRWLASELKKWLLAGAPDRLTWEQRNAEGRG